jgi:hypothetical protein
VEIHPEDENIWRATDEAGNVVFAGQGVRYIVQVEPQQTDATT